MSGKCYIPIKLLDNNVFSFIISCLSVAEMYYSKVFIIIRDKQGYLIRIVTGSQPNAGTTAKVNIKLYGKQRDSPPRLLSAQRPLFASKSTESFVLKYPTSLGKLHHIHIWHDNSGRDPSWFLENVTVTDLNTNRTR